MAESLTLTKKYRAIAALCEYLESLELTGGWAIALDENNQIYEVAQKLHNLLSLDSEYKQRVENFKQSALNAYIDVVKPGVGMINPLPQAMNWALLSRTLVKRRGIEPKSRPLQLV